MCSIPGVDRFCFSSDGKGRSYYLSAGGRGHQSVSRSRTGPHFWSSSEVHSVGSAESAEGAELHDGSRGAHMRLDGWAMGELRARRQGTGFRHRQEHDRQDKRLQLLPLRVAKRKKLGTLQLFFEGIRHRCSYPSHIAEFLPSQLLLRGTILGF